MTELHQPVIDDRQVRRMAEKTQKAYRLSDSLPRSIRAIGRRAKKFNP